MDHVIGMLEFSENTKKETIEKRCHNSTTIIDDCYSGTRRLRTYGKVDFDNRSPFKDYDEAEKFLRSEAERYCVSSAVRYYDYDDVGNISDTKIKEIIKRKKEVQAKIDELSGAHYAKVKSVTVKCKHCGSALATAYCGKTWENNCPICKAELRPQSTLDRLAALKNTLSKLETQHQTEVDKYNAKLKKKAKVKWLVAVVYQE